MSSKRKRKRIRSTTEQTQCNRNNVQRRVSSTRHELHRQICPQPLPVSEELRSEKANRLSKAHGCVYCGALATTEDHLEPLVTGGLPSGLVATVLDMVPCCSWCNSSKGQRHWSIHMERLVEKKRQARDHKDRVKWLVSYDAWRNSHAQRWDVAANMTHIVRLNTLLDDAHAFMQQQVNAAVRSMHGNRAIVVHDRGTRLDWATISKQLLQYGT